MQIEIEMKFEIAIKNEAAINRLTSDNVGGGALSRYNSDVQRACLLGR